LTSDLPEFAWNKECIAQSDPAAAAAPSPIDSPFRRHVKPGTGTMHKSTEDHFFARSTLLSSMQTSWNSSDRNGMQWIDGDANDLMHD